MQTLASIFFLGLALLGTQSKVLAASASEDPYISGFQTYAKEVTQDGHNTFADYAAEVVKLERKVGFIGPKLALPKPVKVMDGVYTVVGSLIWHNPTNYGLNNNLTFIEFEKGVMVFNAGPNPAVAAAFHKMIESYTDKPVKWLAVENSQGHAYLGASYWYDVGVKNLYSHKRANDDFHKGFSHIKAHWSQRVGEELTLSARDISDKFTTFENKLTVDVGGGETIEILNFGPGHTPGSTLVYVPSKNLVLTGDLAYNSRMLALFSYTNTQDWVASFKRFMDAMPKDVTVIPGHGAPTDLATIKRDTYDYLRYMQQEVAKLIKAGKGEEEAVLIDQSQYQDRPVYQQTYQNNASHIYREMTGGSLGENFE